MENCFGFRNTQKCFQEATNVNSRVNPDHAKFGEENGRFKPKPSTKKKTCCQFLCNIAGKKAPKLKCWLNFGPHLVYSYIAMIF